jgi:hypothetical protein
MKPLSKELKDKIVNQLRLEHRIRYGYRLNTKSEIPRTVPRRQTYNIKHLFDDLYLVLNHIHEEIPQGGRIPKPKK